MDREAWWALYKKGQAKATNCSLSLDVLGQCVTYQKHSRAEG